MKPRHSLHRILPAAALATIVFTLGTPAVQAADYYWDSNGSSIATARLGNTGSLVWGTSTNVVTISNPMGRAFLGGTVNGANTATNSADSILFGTEGMGLGATASTIGIVAGGRTINNITFGTAQANAVTLSGGGGSITLAGTTPTIQVNNTTNTIGAVLAGTAGMTKAGAGTLILTGANTYTGTTTISGGGTLQVGNGTTGSINGTTGTALTFNAGGGTFNVREAAGSTQGMGALTFSAGEGTVTSTAATGTSLATLTFASIAARTAGATGNFTLATNTTSTGGTPNKIVFTSTTNVPLASGSNDRGLFFGGTGYARYDATGFIRATNYSGDTNATSVSGADIGVVTAISDVGLSDAITDQTDATANTINLGVNNLTFQATASTLSVNGILSAGSAAGSIANGTNASSIRAAASGGELVIRVNGASDVLTIAPNIVAFGSSSLTKSGAGLLTLSGANTYTGTTTINAGTLSVIGGSAIADTGAVVLANSTTAVFRLDASETIGNISGGGIAANTLNRTGGFSGASVNVQGNTLTLADASDTTFGGTFTGTSSGAIIKSGAGRLTLTSPNSFAGSITLNAGTLRLTAGSNASVAYAISSGGAFNINNGATLNFAPTNVLAYAGSGSTSGYTISNAININTGTANLNFIGGQVNELRSVFTGSVTGGTSGAQTLAVTFKGDRELVMFTGVIADGGPSGTLGLNATFEGGAATAPAYLNLSNTNTFSGPITATSTLSTAIAYLVIGGEAYSAGNNNKVNVAGSGSLGSGNYTNTIALSANTALNYLSSANQILGGEISGAGQVLKEGSGTLTLSAANTYSGGTTLTTGQLNINNSGSGGTSSAIGTGTFTINTGTTIDNTSVGAVTLSTNNAQAWNGNFTFTGTKDLNMGTGAVTMNAARTVTVSGGTLTVGGIISGSTFGLTKSGAGKLTLSGTNAYTGATNVDVGTLEIASGGSTHASSAVTVNGTASLVVNGTLNGTLLANSSTTVSGTGTIVGNATIQGTHNPGNSPGIQTFGNLSYTGGAAIVNWELSANTVTNAANPSAVYDQVVVGGTLDFTGATSLNLLFSGDVLWSDSFWASTQSWTLYDVTTSTANFANLILSTTNWQDGGSNFFDSSARSANTFTLSQSGQDVILNYNVIPEPSTALLGGLGLLALLRRRRA